MKLPDVVLMDGAQAHQLLNRAFADMKCERWEEAARPLESIVNAGSVDLRSAAAEILASIYIGLNQHRPLRKLLRLVGPIGPQLLKASLVLLRNDAIGIEDESLPMLEPSALKAGLAAQRDSGGYALAEYPVIVALLVHLRWLDEALDWLEPMISSPSQTNEGVLEQLLSVLRAAGRHADACNVLARLEGSPAARKLPLVRWRFLNDPSDPCAGKEVPLIEDKVLRFLALGATSAGSRTEALAPPGAHDRLAHLHRNAIG